MDVSKLGIDPVNGSCVKLSYGTITEQSTYTGKDNKPKAATGIVYMGGNERFITEPGSPLSQAGEGEMVLVAQRFQEDRFGWKGKGQPQIVDLPSSAKSKTPSS